MPRLTSNQYLWRASLRVATEIAQNQGKFDFHDADALADIVESLSERLPEERRLKSYEEAYTTIIKVMAQLLKLQKK